MSDVESSQGESSETQFVEQSGDDEDLWEVLEITAEKEKLYKVRWAGTDPKTGKPWPQSWVPKHDCTPALVTAWRMKRPKRKQSTAGSSRSTLRPASIVSTRKKSTTPINEPPRSSSPQSSKKRPRKDGWGKVEVPIGPPSKKRKTATVYMSSPPPILTSAITKAVRSKAKSKSQESLPEEADVITVRSFKPTNGTKPPERPKSVQSMQKEGSMRFLHDHDQSDAIIRVPTPSPPREFSPIIPDNVPQASSSKVPPPPIRSPLLSPNAKARLELWEKEVDFHSRKEDPPSPTFKREPRTNGITPNARSPSPPASPIRITTILDIPSTPRESMVSRMKPKTPLSRSASNATLSPVKQLAPMRLNKKPLRPVPVVTPSTFAPHFPSSSNGNDTIESVEHDTTYEEPIDQFSSPIKGPTQSTDASPQKPVPKPSKTDTLPTLKPPVNGKGKQVPVRRSGRSKPDRLPVYRESPPEVDGLNHSSSEYDEPGQSSLDSQEQEPPPDPLPLNEEERIALRQEEEESSQDLEAEHQQANQRREADKSKLPLFLPEGSPSPPATALRVTRRTKLSSRASEIASLIPKHNPLLPERIEVLDETKVLPSTQSNSQDSTDRTSSQRSQSYPPTQVRHLGAAMTLLNVKSEEISRIEGDLTIEKAKHAALKTEMEQLQEQLAKAKAAAADQANAAAASLEEARAEHATEKALWQSQQDALKAELAELEKACRELKETDNQWKVDEAEWQRERADLIKSASTQAAAQRELGAEADKWEKERLQYDADKAEWEQERLSLADSISKRETEWADERSQWHLEKAKFEAEINELKASVESATTGKKSAEQDRDFFREQYAQASGFVTSVREENSELEKRVKIAESQTSTGVEAVKMLYEARIKATEQEATRWKYLTDILTDRDMRTGGDDIRRRANLEPELRKRLEELEHVVSQLEDELSVHDARASSLEKDREQLQHRSDLWKKLVEVQAEEIAKNNKLAASQLASQLPSVDIGIEPSQLSSQNNLVYPENSSDEMVYRCMWRFETPMPFFACNQAFSNVEELEQHLISHVEDSPESDELEYI